MDISRDFRRKVIMRLIEALKESPSFCNISDSQLNEAVLNSEHQTFQQSKTRDEYVAHINEKLRKIKQTSLSNFEMQNEERKGENRSTGLVNGYEGDRNQIINGNIPAQVKISQAYSHETSKQPGANPRKVETFPSGFGMAYSSPNFSFEKPGYFPDKPQAFGDAFFGSQGGKAIHGYGANLYETRFPSQHRPSLKSTGAGYSEQKQAYGCYSQFRSTDMKNQDQINGNPQLRHSSPPIETGKNYGTSEQTYPSEAATTGRFLSDSYFQGNYDQGLFSPNDADHSYGNHNYGDPNFYAVDQKLFQGSFKEGQPHMGNSQSHVGNGQSHVGNGQPKIPHLFTASNNKLKTEMHTKKFGSPFDKRGDPGTAFSDLEKDPRLVRNPSYRSDNSPYSNPAAKAVPPILNRPVTSTGFSKNINEPFEYNYAAGSPANRSFVGNVNPGLLEKAGLEHEFPKVKARCKVKESSQRPAEAFLPTACLFDDKRSEELFKSFSEEFMKGTAIVPKAQPSELEISESKANSEKPCIDPIFTAEQPSLESTNDSQVSLDEYDDQIPEKLQDFLNKNDLTLKEVKNEAEWKQLFDQVFQKFKELDGSISNELGLWPVLEMQKEFIEFPFCDETDLQEFSERMDRCKLPGFQSISKDDYLEYIDRAIEAFSEKRKEELPNDLENITEKVNQ